MPEIERHRGRVSTSAAAEKTARDLHRHPHRPRRALGARALRRLRRLSHESARRRRAGRGDRRGCWPSPRAARRRPAAEAQAFSADELANTAALRAEMGLGLESLRWRRCCAGERGDCAAAPARRTTPRSPCLGNALGRPEVAPSALAAPDQGQRVRDAPAACPLAVDCGHARIRCAALRSLRAATRPSSSAPGWPARSPRGAGLRPGGPGRAARPASSVWSCSTSSAQPGDVEKTIWCRSACASCSGRTPCTIPGRAQLPARPSMAVQGAPGARHLRRRTLRRAAPPRPLTTNCKPCRCWARLRPAGPGQPGHGHRLVTVVGAGGAGKAAWPGRRHARPGAAAMAPGWSSWPHLDRPCSRMQWYARSASRWWRRQRGDELVSAIEQQLLVLNNYEHLLDAAAALAQTSSNGRRRPARRWRQAGGAAPAASSSTGWPARHAGCVQHERRARLWRHRLVRGRASGPSIRASRSVPRTRRGARHLSPRLDGLRPALSWRRRWIALGLLTVQQNSMR